MKALVISSIVSVFILGIKTTYSDILYHKAYNKDIVIFGLIGIVLQAAWCLFFDVPFGSLFVNVLLAFAISFAFFSLRIWAAGDAKLFTVMILLIPYQFFDAGYYEIFPAFFVLCVIFTLALVYVCFESVVLLLKDIRRKRYAPPRIRFTKETLISWLMGYLVSDTIDNILLFWGSSYVADNSYLLVVFNVLLISALFAIVEKTRWRIITMAVFLVLRFLIHSFTGVFFGRITFSLITTVSIIMFIRMFTNQFNYRAIPTSQVREGQILARCTIVYFLPSTVKDLPKWTDETTRCRLNSDEVAAIKRWENSKYGNDEIIIVRHIPFAPFIFMGSLFFVGLRLYLGVL